MHEEGLSVINFFVLPDSSGAHLPELKLAVIKRTKIEAYTQFADQKGAAREKALEVHNSVAKIKIT